MPGESRDTPETAAGEAEKQTVVAIPLPSGAWLERVGQPLSAVDTVFMRHYRPGNPEFYRQGIADPAFRAQYEPLAREIAREKGIDPDIFVEQIQQESQFNPQAKSHAGAMGLGQLMPETARELGVKNPYNPEENLRGAATYLQQNLRRFDGDYRLALAAYNAGPGTVQKTAKSRQLAGLPVFNPKGAIPPFAETQTYVGRILGRASSVKGFPAYLHEQIEVLEWLKHAQNQAPGTLGC